VATVQVTALNPGTVEREAWEKYWSVEAETPFVETSYSLTREEVKKWEKFRQNYMDEHLAEELSKMSTTDKEDIPKLFRQITHDPGEYDGNRIKFKEWWSNMQLHMMGYEKLPELGKIVAVLT
jgi:hypothetical protein